ncbi:thiamine-binding protein [Arcobacter sp. F2176]|uniref:thiamine-binding protein n=1 Tax=Arcobacter sp. F2176 TaxID=2044511 RepID=UPI00100AD9AA|nr:thiamine-binding protein [Arcobacter sp. F2176]RXJ79798.1 hypothetical protein CRU95_13260 [Arcobacter sp. F2176]
MSVLLEMAMFTTDYGESKSAHVAKVIDTIRKSGYSYQLTSMCTIIETEEIGQALKLIEDCYKVLESLDCNRVYATLTFDIRKGHSNRLKTKVESIEKQIGEVSK